MSDAARPRLCFLMRINLMRLRPPRLSFQCGFRLHILDWYFKFSQSHCPMQNRYYRLPNAFHISLDPLLDELRQFFVLNGHQVQIIPINNGHILQSQKESTLSNLTAQSSALTVRLTREIDGLRVEVGNGKWLDKAAIGLVGYVLLAPLILLPIVGAINQFKLSEDVWEKIEAFVARQNGAPAPGTAYSSPPPPAGYTSPTYYPPPASAVEVRCASCKTVLATGAMFCSRCGTRVGNGSVVDSFASSSPTCPDCGLMNPLGARFCSGCGHRFGG